jgi:hypothetical protein
MHGKQDSGRGFPDLHAETLHVLWQAGQSILDPVLRQHLRYVEVRADAEGDSDGELAVAGGLTAHIQHVLDAVDLLLERCCNGLRDHVGRCAGIACRHLDGRRHDFRILRDRQDEQRTQAEERDEHADHGREDGAVDEGVREGMVESPACHAPLLAVATIVPAAGVTFTPGRARMSPSMTTVSVGTSPLRITRSPR